MNQIINSYLTAHVKEYGISDYTPQEAFEHFVNKCMGNYLRHTKKEFMEKMIVLSHIILQLTISIALIWQ